MFSTTKLIVAGVVIVLLGSLVAFGLLGATSEVPTEPAEEVVAPASRALDWSVSGIDFLLDEYELTVGDTVVTGTGETWRDGDVLVDFAEWESTWFENDREQRLYIQFDIDDSHWWVQSLWAYDGSVDGDWVYFDELADRTRTPLGDSFEADLELTATGSGDEALMADPPTVRLDGLHLAVFAPGTLPAPLTDCEYVVDEGLEVTRRGEGDDAYWSAGYTDDVLQRPGEPLEGYERMSPHEIEAALQEAGLCYRFVHAWPVASEFDDADVDEVTWYYDRRCTAPETGEVGELSFGVDHPSGGPGAIVYVEVIETEPRDWPAPPQYGTDCPSQ